MAKALDEYTMNCSRLTASTAGTLSTAKITSVNSTSSRTANSGVASRLPFSMVNRCGPSSLSVLGMIRWTNLRNLLLAGSMCWLSVNSMRPAVNSRNAPNTYRIQSKRLIRPIPAKMKIARITSAPKIPQNSTRCWYLGGTTK